MRIIDYKVGRVKAHMVPTERRLRIIRRQQFITYRIRALHEHRASRREVAVRTLRTWNIATCTFNINAVSEESCVADFRFRRAELGKIADLIGWDRECTM